MKARSIILVLLGCLLSNPSAASVRISAHTRGQVNDCLPLPDGSLLVATMSGLVHLQSNLQSRRNWTRLDGLPATRIYTLAHAETLTPGKGPGVSSGIWVGTELGLALIRISDGRLSVVRSIDSRPVRALLPDAQGPLVATWGGGVFRLDPNHHRLQPLPFGNDRPSPERKRVTALVRHDNQILVATAGAGLYQIDDGVLTPLQYDLPSNMVFTLHSHAGRLWLGTVAGLLVLDPTGRLRDVSTVDVRSMAAAGEHLLAGTFGQGVVRVADFETAPVNMPDDSRFVTTVVHRRNVTCVGTTEGFWVRLNGEPWRRAVLSAPPSTDISALAPDGSQRLWVGTFDRGLALLDNGRWRTVSSPLIDRRINALALETDGASKRLWIATARGVSVLEGRRVQRFSTLDGLPDNDVHAVTVLRGGGVVVGTARGAAIIRNDSVNSIGRKQGLPHRAVWSVAEDSAGNLWLGTTVGLYRWQAGAKPQRFSTASGHLTDDFVTAITFDGHTVWVGTYSHGVCRLRLQQGGVVAAGHFDGGYVNVGGLIVLNQRLYAATMGGLKSIPLSGNTRWTTHGQAAPGQDVTGVAPTQDGLWVSSRRGLTRIPLF